MEGEGQEIMLDYRMRKNFGRRGCEQDNQLLRDANSTKKRLRELLAGSQSLLFRNKDQKIIQKRMTDRNRNRTTQEATNPLDSCIDRDVDISAIARTKAALSVVIAEI